MEITVSSLSRKHLQTSEFAQKVGASADKRLRPLAVDMFAESPIRKSLYHELRAADKRQEASVDMPLPKKIELYKLLNSFTSQNPHLDELLKYLPTYIYPVSPDQLSEQDLTQMMPADRDLYEKFYEKTFSLLQKSRVNYDIPDNIFHDLRTRGVLSDEQWQHFFPNTTPLTLTDRLKKMLGLTKQPQILPMSAEHTHVDLNESNLHLARGITQTEDLETLAVRLQTLKGVVKNISTQYPQILPAFVLNGSGSKGYWTTNAEDGKPSDFDIIVIPQNTIALNTYIEAVHQLMKMARDKKIEVDTRSLYPFYIPDDFSAESSSVNFSEVLNATQDKPPSGAVARAFTKFINGEIIVDENDAPMQAMMINLKRCTRAYLHHAPRTFRDEVTQIQIGEVLGGLTKAFSRKYPTIPDRDLLSSNSFRALASLLFVEKVGLE